jgi:GWxTD domain-containing protein
MDAILRILVESSVRALVIAVAVASVLQAMRVKSPAVLHHAWTGVLAAMLILPAFSLWGPKIPLPLLPPAPVQSANASAGTAPALKIDSIPASMSPDSRPATLDSPFSPVQAIRTEAMKPPQTRWGASDFMVMVYLAGLLFLVARLLTGMIISIRLMRSASPVGRAYHSARCLVPLSVGLVSARVLLPLQSKAWPDDELEAVLVHELEHVRRRDPLVEWLVMLNRSIYWFHPLAWWLRHKLAALAELACDEAVLARGHDPARYAELLLQLARSVNRGGILVAIRGVSIHGSSLAVRIGRILTVGRSPAISRSRKRVVAALCAVAIILPSASSLVRARAKAPAWESRIGRIRPEDPITAGRQDLPDVSSIVRELPQHVNAVPSSSSQDSPRQTSNGRLPTGNIAWADQDIVASDKTDKNLESVYKKWLNEDVIYIVTPEERETFLSLQTNQQRDNFIKQFWGRRAKDPGTGGDAVKQEHYRRLAYANEHFAAGMPGWRTDRGRIYIKYGAPDGKEAHPTGGVYSREFWDGGGQSFVYPFERWRYRHIDGVGDDVEIEFVDRYFTGNLAIDNGKSPLADTQGSRNAPLPFFAGTYFMRTSDGKSSVLLSIALANKDLTFRKDGGTNKATVIVYSVMYRGDGVLAAEFEQSVNTEFADDALAKGMAGETQDQKMLWVEAGQSYRIEVTVMDVISGRSGTETYGVLVPKHAAGALQASSVILANRVNAVPPDSDTSNAFVIGDMKVIPNLRTQYANGQFLIPYLQIYDASIDPATEKPSLQISFAIKSGDRVLSVVEDPNGKSVMSSSADRAVIVSGMPVRDLLPGRYQFEIRVMDKISNRTVVASTFFEVRNSSDAPFERLSRYFNVKR